MSPTTLISALYLERRKLLVISAYFCISSSVCDLMAGSLLGSPLIPSSAERTVEGALRAFAPVADAGLSGKLLETEPLTVCLFPAECPFKRKSRHKSMMMIQMNTIMTAVRTVVFIISCHASPAFLRPECRTPLVLSGYIISSPYGNETDTL